MGDILEQLPLALTKDHTLQTIYILNFIYDIFLYSRGTFNGQNVSRSNRT